MVLGMCACTRGAQTGEVQTAPSAESTSETTTQPSWQWQKSSLDEQGLIESVDTPISAYLPRVLELDDERWQQITVRHLLTHTSGIQTTDDALWDAWRESPNWLEYIYALPIVSEPGARFSYSTGNTHLLCAILQAVAGESVDSFAKKYLFGPVGMESASIAADAQGISDGGQKIMKRGYV